MPKQVNVSDQTLINHKQMQLHKHVHVCARATESGQSRWVSGFHQLWPSAYLNITSVWTEFVVWKKPCGYDKICDYGTMRHELTRKHYFTGAYSVSFLVHSPYYR